jgi:hypothetical protein
VLQPALPHGFVSWPQVLTDWGVTRAYLGNVRPPACLAGRPRLATAFVAEIGLSIRRIQLRQRVMEVTLLREKATEPAHESAGGTDYLELSAAMHAVQERYFAASRRCQGSADGVAAADLVSLRTEMTQRQSAFRSARQAHEPVVQAARADAARAYWSARPAPGIPDTFFADAPAHSAAARMARIHPAWWGAFFARLQKSLSHGHPADGHLLEVLPQLRRDARKLKLSVLLADWHRDHADRWGLYADIHYRMLSRRAARKGVQLTDWFRARARGYLTRKSVRFSLHAELAERLAAADPWTIPAHDPAALLSEHGPN